ncbi:unnamed protein product [Chilo suppressalis]|uniref:Nose resistant-to-fluoxetine protein N-terminal domain-containing protein n=1 Tax=Chilo suppressalis TaxID=168631 RepID=A0ABN8BEB9_CHISP|nr:unnamed protein product [Chilo suppressalis]
MLYLKLILLNIVFIKTMDASLVLDPLVNNNAFDVNLYEEVLDPAECARQIEYILTNDTTLLSQFLDAGVRTPRGMLEGNFVDMGNYFQCLGINKEVRDMSIEGKYCAIEFPLKQDELKWPTLPTLPEIPEIPWPNITWPPTWPSEPLTQKILDEEKLKNYNLFIRGRDNLKLLLGDDPELSLSRVAEGNPLANIRFQLAVCLPKVCSPKTALQIITPSFFGNISINENYCRLKNDKPWVAADTVAIVIFSVIGLLTLLSTSYDLRHSVLLERDPKEASKLYTSFSVYTNSRKFFTFRPNPNALTCLDGIRSIAMIWVIVGHTFSTQLSLPLANPLHMFDFLTSFTSLWITGANITVDTFFVISGLLLVYTVASKLTSINLIKNLHLFYLNRLLRMFPVLATAILLQVSFFNRITDGPFWEPIARNTNNCRQYWWSTLLYVQNLVNARNMCLSHSWYLAIDMQAYILSPLVLFWVLGRSKKSAWIALTAAVLIVITASSIYNFLMEFQSAFIALSRSLEDAMRYYFDYYFHTLPRISPFFVGMLFGYVMHLCKGKTIRLSKVLVVMLWILAGATNFCVFISTYFTMKADWDNQTVDSILNSFMRPAWAASIGWLTFACAKGYGGPINWFLSLHIFKILGRLSYAMYILHYPLIYIIYGTALAPIYFSVEYSIQRFFIDFMVAVIASYLVTVLIDMPFSQLIGMVLGGQSDQKRNDKKKNDDLKRADDVVPRLETDLNKTEVVNSQNGIKS